MIFRTVLVSSCFVLASCGAQSATQTAERLEQVENDCGMLTTEASLETRGTAPSNFCY